MDSGLDTTGRSAGAYVLFALAFLGFMVAAGGVIVAAPVIAFVGWILLVLSVLAYRLG